MKKIAALLFTIPHLINTLQQGVLHQGDKRNRFNGLLHVLAVLTFLTLLPARSHANVYATNIRLNGGVTNIVAPGGTNVLISYSLNESATLGVTINISSGTTIVRTFTLASPAPGTLQGSNYVIWDGRNNANNPVAGGVYSISITAGSSGYTSWAQTSSETNDVEYHVWEPRGIAVNRNTNSPYYGRVFVANANQGIDPFGHLGDRVGILILNADGTYAAEWGFSTGGYDWAHNQPAADGFSPWKMEVGPDDRLYVNDFLDQGLVFSFDQLVSTNSLTAVLRSDNYWANSFVNYDGLFISGSADNMQFWMADSNDIGSANNLTAGIRRWNLTSAGIVATNDTGVTIVAPGSPSGLDQVPNDVALDSNNNIYAIQDRRDQGDGAWRVMRFPAYTNVAETNAEWRIGSGVDSMAGASGIAVDPAATYVAVAFKGFFVGSYENGSASVFYATNGASVTNFAAGDSHYDVAWDNVGNLYTVDNLAGRWRTYSPPGTNHATTVAVPTVQVTVPTPLVLSNPSYSNGQFQFTLSGDANATYIILLSTNLVNWLPVATNTSTLAVREITNNVAGSRTFFRARVGP
jgi:hypothetical protein